MAVVLTYGAGVPVVKLGRIAGQFAKPRSSPTERVGDQVIDSFRGHMVNDDLPEPAARVPDPVRLITAYQQSVSTLNLLRAFTKGGFADLSQVHAWNQEFVASSTEGRRFEDIAEGIDRALRFMSACGINLTGEDTLHEVDFWTSHEALILDYEEALTRRDSLTDDWYDCSAHMLWVGERTRQLDGAHVEFLSGIHNPVGSKVGPTATPDDVVALCERLNPGRVPGRLTLITRFGADAVEAGLPPLLRAVREEGHPVVWVCDPMHGNTITAEGGDQDPALRRHRRRAPRVLRRPPVGGDLARRGPRRAHRRRRHRVPGRRGGHRGGPVGPAVHLGLRPPAQRPAVPRPGLCRGRAPPRLIPTGGGSLTFPTTATRMVPSVDADRRAGGQT